MNASHKYHIAIRRIAIIVAAINLVSCFALDLREWLVYFDPWIVFAVVCPSFAIALPSLPYLLPVAQRTKTSTATLLSLIFVTLLLCFFEALWFLMIAIAVICRGPNWNFYWPWEERVPKIVALNNINLSEWVWIYHLGQPLPAMHLSANRLVSLSSRYICSSCHWLYAGSCADLPCRPNTGAC